MKTYHKKSLGCLAVLFILLLQTSIINAEENNPTLSPYFKILGEQIGDTEQLPLLETSAQVDIAGVIADVKVRQVYQNRGESAIEAIYVFLGSSKAAVYGMQMTLGERTIVAKIKERKAAKKSYLQAKKLGKRASLLEQQRPNVFQMNVANIMPGDKVVVELSYTELIVPEQGVYEFVYPAVVGPRYSETASADATESENWISNPYLHQGKQPPTLFDINLSVTAGIPIQALSSPSHKVQVNYDKQGSADVQLKSGEHNAGDRDYILRYQLRGKTIESGLILHKGDKENFFLLMSQPPKRVAAKNIPAREYIFVVDVSGSMHGFPLDTSKKLMVELLSNLRTSDSFNILFFSGGSSVLSEKSLPVTRNNINKAISMMERQRGGGGTRLLPAIKTAMALPAEESTSRSFVVVTDGYVSVETEAFDYIRNNLNNANFFSFGIGSSVNRFLIEGLAHAGQGEPFVITSPKEAISTALKFRQYIETPVLTHINLEFDGLDVYDVEPKTVPDLFAEKPLIIYGKWRGNAEGKIHISGQRGGSDYSESIDISTSKANNSTAALRYLWARQRIAQLGDYEKIRPDSDRQAEITNLGLSYNLLTAYTSFIAIDEVTVNPNGQNTKVKQPLPLPKGVSNLAVGGIVPTTPEPGIIALLSVLALFFMATFINKSRYLIIKNR